MVVKFTIKPTFVIASHAWRQKRDVIHTSLCATLDWVQLCCKLIRSLIVSFHFQSCILDAGIHAQT